MPKLELLPSFSRFPRRSRPHISIKKLKEIHTATHPSARLEPPKRNVADDELVLGSGDIESGRLVEDPAGPCRRAKMDLVTNPDEIVAAALALDPAVRQVVLDRIAATLDPSLEEATSRAREMREGLVEEIPLEQAMKDARALLD